MTLGRTFRLFRIVVQRDNEIWLIELPPEGSDTIGDISLILLLTELFGDELDYDEDAYPNGPIVVYGPDDGSIVLQVLDDEQAEDSPEDDSCAFVICLARRATLVDADHIEKCLEIWLRANNEQAEIVIENPA